MKPILLSTTCLCKHKSFVNTTRSIAPGVHVQKRKGRPGCFTSCTFMAARSKEYLLKPTACSLLDEEERCGTHRQWTLMFFRAKKGRFSILLWPSAIVSWSNPTIRLL